MDDKKKIILLLNARPGKEYAIPYKTIAYRLNMNERHLRSTVADLITQDRIPIGTISTGDNPGYFMISNREEFEQAHGELISRIKKLSQRAKGLRVGYHKYIHKPEQEVLF